MFASPVTLFYRFNTRMMKKWSVASTREPNTEDVVTIRSYQPAADGSNRLERTPQIHRPAILLTQAEGPVSDACCDHGGLGSIPPSRGLTPVLEKQYSQSSMASTGIDLSESDDDLKLRVTPPDAMKDVSPAPALMTSTAAGMCFIYFIQHALDLPVSLWTRRACRYRLIGQSSMFLRSNLATYILTTSNWKGFVCVCCELWITLSHDKN